MQNGVLIEQVDRETLLGFIENVDKSLTAINGKLSPPPATVWLTTEQVAERLQVSRVSVWDWTKKGLLKSYRIGNQVRYIESEVNAALAARTNK
jgi:excisionase family DNA binding protein